jgi:hypothetical protein
VGSDAGVDYLVMEYLEGVGRRHLVAAPGTL